MLDRLYWKCRWNVLNRVPFLLNVLRLVPGLRHTVVSRKTDLLIEGYPRSGNTFARNAFLLACDGRFFVTSHLHLISSVRKAIRLRKPILILIRRPVEAVCSFLVYKGEHFPVKQALAEYIDFYRYVLEHRESMVVASFDEVTSSFGQVVEQVNRRFKTAFPLFEHTAENEQQCIQMTHDQISPWPADRGTWSETRKRSAPSSGRDALKQQARDALMNMNNQEMLLQAEELYAMLTQVAE